MFVIWTFPVCLFDCLPMPMRPTCVLRIVVHSFALTFLLAPTQASCQTVLPDTVNVMDQKVTVHVFCCHYVY